MSLIAFAKDRTGRNQPLNFYRPTIGDGNPQSTKFVDEFDLRLLNRLKIHFGHQGA